MSFKLAKPLTLLPPELRRIVERLTPEQAMLIVLKRELYQGRWSPMIDDLTNRLAGRPHVVRLAARISDDLARIEQLQGIEARFDIDLAELLAPLDEQETAV